MAYKMSESRKLRYLCFSRISESIMIIIFVKTYFFLKVKYKSSEIIECYVKLH